MDNIDELNHRVCPMTAFGVKAALKGDFAGRILLLVPLHVPCPATWSRHLPSEQQTFNRLAAMTSFLTCLTGTTVARYPWVHNVHALAQLAYQSFTTGHKTPDSSLLQCLPDQDLGSAAQLLTLKPKPPSSTVAVIMPAVRLEPLSCFTSKFWVAGCGL